MNNENKLIIAMAILFTCTACVYRFARGVANIAQIIGTLIGFYLLYKHRKDLSFESNHWQYVKYWGFFVLCLVPSVFVSTDTLFSLMKLLEFHIYRPLIFIFILLFVKERWILQGMLMTVFTIESIDCLCIIYQFVINHVPRPTGFGENPLNMTAVIVILLPSVLTVALNKDYFGSKLSNVSKCLSFCYLGGFFACQNRSLWVAGLPSVLVATGRYILMSFKRLAILIVIISVTFGFIISNPQYKSRIMSITNTETNSSNLGRFYVWRGAFKMYKDHPIAGVGITQFEKHYVRNYVIPAERYILPHAHSIYFQVAAECGIIGLIGLFTLISGFLATSIKSYRKNNNPVDLILIGINIGFICLFGFFEPSIMFANSSIRIYWVIVASLLQLQYLNAKEDNRLKSELK